MKNRLKVVKIFFRFNGIFYYFSYIEFFSHHKIFFKIKTNKNRKKSSIGFSISRIFILFFYCFLSHQNIFFKIKTNKNRQLFFRFHGFLHKNNFFFRKINAIFAKSDFSRKKLKIER